MRKELAELQFRLGEKVELDIRGVLFSAVVEGFGEQVLILRDVMSPDGNVEPIAKLQYASIGEKCEVRAVDEINVRDPVRDAHVKKQPQEVPAPDLDAARIENLEDLIETDWQPQTHAEKVEQRQVATTNDSRAGNGFFDDFTPRPKRVHTNQRKPRTQKYEELK